MSQAVVRIATTALLALAAAWGNAQAGNWGDVAIVSGTLGNQGNRVCVGAPDIMRPADFGCPTHSMYITSGGLVGINTNNPNAQLDVYGTISATNFVGNGSGLFGVTAGATDRIVSGSSLDTRMVAISNTGYISITQNAGSGSSNTGWFSPYTGLVTLGVSTTGPVSATQIYVGGFSNTQRGLTVRSLYGANSHIPFSDGQVYLTGDRSAGATGTGDIILRSHNGTGNTTHVTIKGDSGNVGIGTTAPIATLQVSGTFIVSNSGAPDAPSIFAGSNGNVGIGTQPGGNVHLQIVTDTTNQSSRYGVFSKFTQRATSTGNYTIAAMQSQIDTIIDDGISNTGVVNSLGAQALRAHSLDSGTLTGLVGLSVQIGHNAGSTDKTTTNAYGILIAPRSTAGTINNLYGVYLGGLTGSNVTNRYGLYQVDAVATNYFAGKLGIGRTAPLANLDVVGTISATGAVQVGTSALTCGAPIAGAIRYNSPNIEFCNGSVWAAVGSGTGLGDRIVSGTTNAIAWEDRSLTITTAGVQRMIVAENGRVGIGLTVPGERLHVAGNVRIKPDNQPNAGVLIDGGVGYNRIYSYSGDHLVFDGGGNFGVKASSPTATLQVSGSFIVSTSSGNSWPSLYVDANGGVGMGISTTSGLGTLNLWGQGTRSNLNLGGSVSEGLGAVYGAVQFYGGASTATSAEARLGMIFASTSGTTTGQRAGRITVNVKGDGQNMINNRLVVDAYAVGISTSNPRAALDVVGSISLTDALQLGQNTIACSTPVSGSIRYNTVSNSVQFCNGTGWVSLSSGTAGTLTSIGGSDPLVYLPVSTTSWMPGGNSDASFLIENSALVGGSGAFLQLTARDSGNRANVAYIGAISTEGTRTPAVVFGQRTASTAYAERMRLSPDGYLGIGTTSPAATLQVSGTFSVSSTINSTTPTLYVGLSGVGIGTATPSGSLDVRGGSGASGGAQSYFSAYAGWGGPVAGSSPFSSGTKLILWDNTSTPQKISMGMDGNADMWFNNAGAQLASGFTFYTGNGASATPTAVLKITKSGNVGVSNTSPIAKLDVVGTISLTDALQLGQSTIACGTQVSGSIRYNAISNTVQFCNGSMWASLASGTSAGTANVASNTGAVQFNLNNQLAGDTDNFYWDNANKRLGVRASAGAVSATLHVSSTSGVPGLRLSSPGGLNNAAQLLLEDTNQADANTPFYFFRTYGGSLVMGNANRNATTKNTTGSTDYLAIGPAGNVGINILSPTATLQVNGSFVVSLTTQTTTPTFSVGSNGLVGVRTSNPFELFHIGNDELGGRMFIGEDGATRKGLLIAAYKSVELSSATYPPYVRLAPYDYATNSSIPLVISPHTNPRVAIGKFNPLAVLDVAGTISASNAIQVGSSSLTCGAPIAGAIRFNSPNIEFCNGTSWSSVGTGSGQQDRIVSGTTSAIAYLDRSLTISTAGTERVVFGENGNIGIGTQTPSDSITLMKPLAASIPAIWLGAGNTSGYARLGVFATGGALSMGSNTDSQSVLIRSYTISGVQGYINGGTFGFGTTSPVATLQVSGTFTVSTSAQTASAPSFYIGTDGSVGVGTASPNSFFHVGQGKSARIELGTSQKLSLGGQGTFEVDAIGTTGGRLMLAANGNLGISRSTPLAKLDVMGSISLTDALQLGQNTMACATGVSGSIRYNTVSNTVQFCNGTGWTSLASGTTGGGSGLADRIYSGTVSMTANANGYISLTTAGTDWGYFSNGISYLPTLTATRVSSTNISATLVHVNGDILYTGSIYDVSDRRLKESIESLPPSLEKLLALRPVRFRMRGDTRTELGFIVQEVQRYFPELVGIGGDSSKTLSLNYVGLIAPMVQSIHELKADNDNLRLETQSLRRELEADRGRNKTLQADLKAANDNMEALGRRLEALEKSAGASR